MDFDQMMCDVLEALRKEFPDPEFSLGWSAAIREYTVYVGNKPLGEVELAALEALEFAGKSRTEIMVEINIYLKFQISSSTPIIIELVE